MRIIKIYSCMLYIKMDFCSLSSTGLQDIDANDIIADNITVLSK